MGLYWQVVAALGLLSIAFCAAAESTGKCAWLPNVIATPNNVTYEAGKFLTGEPWYGYLTYSSSAGLAQQNPDDVNVINYYTSLGNSREPTRFQASEVIQQEKRRYVKGACVNMFEISQFTTDGRQFGPVFDVDTNGAIVGDAYDKSIVMSTDQKTYVLFFWCSENNWQPGVWQTGACASAHLYVYTRTKPTAMKDDQKQSIAKAVDAALKPYCLQSSKFAQYKWDDSLPECPKGTEPECFTHNVNAYKTLVDKKSSASDSKGQKAAAGAKPEKGQKGAKDAKDAKAKGSKGH